VVGSKAGWSGGMAYKSDTIHVLGVTTAVRMKGEESKEFEVKVGVHQGSVLSPLLFTIMLENGINVPIISSHKSMKDT